MPFYDTDKINNYGRIDYEAYQSYKSPRAAEYKEAKMKIDDNTLIWSDYKHFLWIPLPWMKYEIKGQKLYRAMGLLKTDYEETWLYRIVDVKLTRTILQRICGTGTVELYTRLDNQAKIPIVNIKEPARTKQLFADLVAKYRDERGISEREFQPL